MTEWLLSSHNTQESSGVAAPLSMTRLAESVYEQLTWLLQQLGGKLDDFDPTLKPIQIVQGQGYGNMTYYGDNMSKVLPTDAQSIGMPPELIEMSKVPFRRMALLPLRFYRTARWASRYYEDELPAFQKQLHQCYHDLRANENDPLPLIWPLFEPDFVERCDVVDRARIMSAVLVMALDAPLRQQAPGLMALFTGLDTDTSLIGQKIWELRELAEACGPEVTEKLKAGVVDVDTYRQLPSAAPLVAALDEFLETYGHRGFKNELDFETARLIDRPDLVLLAVASQLSETRSPAERSKASREPGQQALDAMPPLKRMLWSRVMNWGQNLIGHREAFKSTLSLAHAIYGLAARYLSRHFFPGEPEDVLYLYTWDEFLDFTRSKGDTKIPMETVNRRRAELELHLTQPPPPEIIWYNPETQHWRPALEEEETESTVVETTGQFQGIGASAGQGSAEGIALVTNDPIEAGRRLLEMQGDVILVTRLTDPAWSSLFARLSGVVTELGGVISHAAIVARENGLPAIVGVADITQNIRNGQRLRVDGTTGEVEVLE